MPTLLPANREAWNLWMDFLTDQYDYSEVGKNSGGKEYRVVRRRFLWETAVAMVEKYCDDVTGSLQKIAVIEREFRKAERD